MLWVLCHFINGTEGKADPRLRGPPAAVAASDRTVAAEPSAAGTAAPRCCCCCCCCHALPTPLHHITATPYSCSIKLIIPQNALTLTSQKDLSRSQKTWIYKEKSSDLVQTGVLKSIKGREISLGTACKLQMPPSFKCHPSCQSRSAYVGHILLFARSQMLTPASLSYDIEICF